jgi:hypothetical protein
MLLLLRRVMAGIERSVGCDAYEAVAYMRHFLFLTRSRQICPGGDVHASINAGRTTKAGANYSTTVGSLGARFALNAPATVTNSTSPFMSFGCGQRPR